MNEKYFAMTYLFGNFKESKFICADNDLSNYAKRMWKKHGHCAIIEVYDADTNELVTVYHC